MLRPTLALLALLLVCSVAQGQDHKHVELEVVDKTLHQLWGKVRAVRIMQTFILAHIATRDGLDAAKTLLAVTEKSFDGHVQMLNDQVEKDLSKSHWLSQGLGKELKRTTKLFQEGGRQHLKDLERMVLFLEAKAKSK